MIEKITDQAGMIALREKLGLRKNWHEPDEREVTARAFGVSFDNAGFYGDGEVTLHMHHTRIDQAEAEEMWLRIYRYGEPVADVNMATLCALACGEKVLD